ncbi:MAG: hypothetical protein WCF84_26365, partial [Anaerolineae bacterium]
MFHHPSIRSILFVMGIGLVLCALMACGSAQSAPAAQPPANTPAAPGAPTAANKQTSPGTSTTPGTSTASGHQAATQILANSGFRPEVDGLPFENYVNQRGISNMTAEDMVRVFGDQVCGSKIDGKCILTPPAWQWMDKANTAMANGHCYGMSVAALNLWKKRTDLSVLGASAVPDLKFDGNTQLQREIATSWTYQNFESVRKSVIQGAPNDILDKLVAILKQGSNAPDTYTIGFFKEDGSGGHAVTPYAIEDRGNGIMAVLIWDNNYPKVSREILFDRNNNKWSYNASTNPNEAAAQYTGSWWTKSLSLYPTNPGNTTQPCSFCRGANGRVGGAALAAEQYNQIYLTGDEINHAHLLITDAQGRRYGYLPDGSFVTEIPGVEHEYQIIGNPGAPYWLYRPEPIYYIPSQIKFVLKVDGSKLTKADKTEIVMIGPGYDIGISSLNIQPGEQDEMTPSPDGTDLQYKPDRPQSVDVLVGDERPGPDYAFTLKGLDLDGGEFDVKLDNATGKLDVDTNGSKTTSSYDIEIDRIDNGGETVFAHNDIQLKPEDQAAFDFGAWGGDGKPVEMQLEHTNGTGPENVGLSDQEIPTVTP